MRTLREAFLDANDEEDFGFRLRNFLDEFYAAPDPSAFAEEPESLTAKFADDKRADTYLAALAEHLCRDRGWAVPAWSRAPWRMLETPFFAMRTPRGRAFLLQDSPAAFRVRNIFISADALSRV